MIKRLLIANRGEIARRIIHTCNLLGIETTAVYSDADARAPHVAEATTAVALPGTAAADTYLRGDLLIDAAQRAGCDAIHPGYGFLSEDASFAQAVIDAGLIWVGPPSSAISAMGSKIAAKELMAMAGVPVLERIDPVTVTLDQFPLLVKASAGGGGRGMRIVHTADDLAAQIETASAEAQAAFGDPAVYCERYLPASRHIEVQIFGDSHGTIWVLGERECSVQRRHQKVIEETPSPLAERIPGLRERLFDAARAAAQAVDYVGAGTIEFLATDAGEFWFLEMNTRLQVEHTVTECVTGLDLVALQLDIADGAALADAPPAPRGHAIQARLYAEHPLHGWRPSSGTIHHFSVPNVTTTFATGERGAVPTVRLDAGVVDGAEISSHYDSMLAKVIAWAPIRDAATRRLAATLRASQIHGVTTNRDLLVRVLHDPVFEAGDADTSLLEGPHAGTLAAPLLDSDAERCAALAAALADAHAERSTAPILGYLPLGWRNIASQPHLRTYTGPSGTHDIHYRITRDGLDADGFDVTLADLSSYSVTLLNASGVAECFGVARYGDLVCVETPHGSVTLTTVARFPETETVAAVGSLLAPMAGTVSEVAVCIGDDVEPGQPLMWIEAMKMRNEISAPHAGTVDHLSVAVGDHVPAGTVLAVVAQPLTTTKDTA